MAPKLAKRKGAASASSLSPVSIGFTEKLCQYGKASFVADKTESERIAKMACALSVFVNAQARELVTSAGKRPIMMFYSSDGTPIKTQVRVSKRLTATKVIQRQGKQVHEYLAQVGFLR